MYHNILSFEEFVNENEISLTQEVFERNNSKQVPIKNIFISTSTLSGDLGAMKKGEIYIKSKSDNGKDYVFLELADPNYEYYEDVHVDDFKKHFRQIDPIEDTPQMTKLSKWGLVEFGEQYWVINISPGGGGYKKNLEKSLEPGTKTSYLKKVTSESPKQAILKSGAYKAGRVDSIGRDIWVAKEYADSMFIVMTKDPKELGVTKILNIVKKSGLLDKYLVKNM